VRERRGKKGVERRESGREKEVISGDERVNSDREREERTE
jgi:hypothetical protein